MSTPKQAFARRLNEALDRVRFPAQGKGRLSQLSELLGSDPEETDRWLKGSAFPPTSVLVKLAALTQTRSNWLFTGQGEPYEPGKRPPGVGPTGGDTALSQEALRLARLWSRLPAQQRQAIARVVEELAGDKGKA